MEEAGLINKRVLRNTRNKNTVAFALFSMVMLHDKAFDLLALLLFFSGGIP